MRTIPQKHCNVAAELIQADDNFRVVRYRIRNRGVITTINREKNAFLFRYVGRIIPVTKETEAPKKEEYAVYFRHADKRYVCEADEDDGSLGRLCNHSIARQNMKPAIIQGSQGPIIYFYALRQIDANEELLWDYNDTDAPEEDRVWLLTKNDIEDELVEQPNEEQDQPESKKDSMMAENQGQNPKRPACAGVFPKIKLRQTLLQSSTSSPGHQSEQFNDEDEPSPFVQGDVVLVLREHLEEMAKLGALVIPSRPGPPLKSWIFTVDSYDMATKTYQLSCLMTVKPWVIHFPDYWVSVYDYKKFDPRSIQRTVVNLWNSKRTAANIREEPFDQDNALTDAHKEYASLLDNVVDTGTIGQDEPFVQDPDPIDDPLLTMDAIRARYPFMPTEIRTTMRDRLMEEKVANITLYYIQSNILATLAEVPQRLAQTLEREVINTTTCNIAQVCLERTKRILLYSQNVCEVVRRNLVDLVNGEDYITDNTQLPQASTRSSKIDFESIEALKDKGEPTVENGLVVLELKALSSPSADEWQAVVNGYAKSKTSVTIRGVKYKEYPKVPIWFSNLDPKPLALKASIDEDGTDMQPKNFRFIHPYGKYGVYLYVCRYPTCAFISENKSNLHRHQIKMKHAKLETKKEDDTSSPPAKRAKKSRDTAEKHPDRVIYENNVNSRSQLIARKISQNDSWLTDLEIDYYGAFINSVTEDYLVMPCTMFNRYFHYNHDEVAHWTTLDQIKTIFNYTAVFFPINHNRRHWTLGYIAPKERMVYHYNGFNVTGALTYPEVAKYLLKYVMEEANAKNIDILSDGDEWQTKEISEPIQGDSNSCGPFLLEYIRQYVTGRPISFHQDDIRTIRVNLSLEVNTGTLITRD